MSSNNIKVRLKRIDKLDYIESFKRLLPTLKRSGNNFKCKSPFNKEKTPSFVVNPTKRIWKCFSTGLGGRGLVSFIQEYKELNFENALDYTESMFGLGSSVDLKTIIDILSNTDNESQFSYDTKKYNFYHSKLLDLMNSYRSRYPKSESILSVHYEYIYDEFDLKEFNTYRDFDRFLRWANDHIRYFLKYTYMPVLSLSRSKSLYINDLGKSKKR